MLSKPILAIAITLTLGLGLACGDPQLDQSRREPFFVAASEWSTLYGPRQTVLVPFPDLTSVANPRFQSSNATVAAVGVFNHDLGDPGRRVLRISTGVQGDADISLFDSDTLVRTESIRVVKSTNWQLDLTIQNRVTPPEAALDPAETLLLLEFARVPALVAFHESDALSSGANVVAGARVESAVDIVVERFFDNRPLGGELGDARLAGQLNMGDVVSVIAMSRPSMVVEFANGEKIYSRPVTSVRSDRVRDLQVIVTPASGSVAPAIAVYGWAIDPTGASRDVMRVIGLNPVVTVDGNALNPYFGRVDGAASSLPIEWPWLFTLPPNVTSGTVEARWRGISASVNLGAEE